ncbi:MAG: carboxypeptidase-like regulatory domain-containing protein [Bacteroidetes bacterium]|nr:carboxypeptidase-like regulatory domain-containing protein [Bacteroidota bacterium]
MKGTVIDKKTNEPIPFSSVGIIGKTMGTVSNENGYFELVLKEINETDSLKISAIGYQSKSYTVKQAKNFIAEKIYLNESAVLLNEVVIKPSKTITKVLGNKNYNKNISCSFQGVDNNYKGVQAAIKANNKKGRVVWIENFNFFISKNDAADSAMFRLNFYKEDKNGMPGENILRQPIVFKTKVERGEVSVDLKKYNINTNDDFFISLECLSDNINSKNLAFSGALLGPSYFKLATFSSWEKIIPMGIDFNVTVTYQK